MTRLVVKMVAPASPLSLCSATLNFLDFAAILIDQTVKSSQTSDSPAQEPRELEREAEKLREVDSSYNLQRTPSDANKPEHERTEAEKGVQKVYDKCKTLADRLVPAVQACQTKSKDGKPTIKAENGKKGDLEKYKKDIESLKAECAVQLQKLLCKPASK